MSPRVVEKASCDLPPVTSSLFSTLSAIAEVEQFVCNLYGAPDVTGECDETRRVFFELGKSLESLPPTTDALELHVESQLPSQSMASGRQMPHATGTSSRLRRMGGNK